MAERSIPPATARFAAHVGAEAVRRPAPSPARALGGFGALLAGAGLAVVGLDVVLDGGSRAGVALLFLLYAGGGWVLLVFGRPVQRTAGVTAVAVAVPAVLGFLVLERGGWSSSDATSVLALSTVAWGVLHVAGPARGHGVLLGAALTGAWGTVMVGTDALGVLDPGTFGPAPDLTGAAVASLLFGTAYLVTGHALDRAGLAGTATGFLGAALVALAAGVGLALEEASGVVVGLLLVAAGAAVGLVGGRTGRRAATWAGAGAAVAGLGLALAAAFGDDDVTPAGFALLGAGAAVALGAHRLAGLPGEADEPPETP